MQLNKRFKTIGLSTIVTILLVGCGGGDDATPTNTTQTDTTQTGTFVDAPVQGLAYKTATQSGFTGVDGRFKYIAGEEVEFRLGNLYLGKALGAKLLTPYSITAAETDAVNVALVVQNFDNNRTDNVLNIEALKDYNFTDFNMSDRDGLITKLTTLLASSEFQAIRGGTEFDLLDETTVQNAMDEYLILNAVDREPTVTEGFSSGWLDGKTLYGVIPEVDIVYEFQFSNGYNKLVPDPEDGAYNQPYDITEDGMIRVFEDPNYEYYRIYSINGSEIAVCESETLEHINNGCTNISQYFFTNKEDAEVKLDDINTPSVENGFTSY